MLLAFLYGPLPVGFFVIKVRPEVVDAINGQLPEMGAPTQLSIFKDRADPRHHLPQSIGRHQRP